MVRRSQVCGIRAGISLSVHVWSTVYWICCGFNVCDIYQANSDSDCKGFQVEFLLLHCSLTKPELFHQTTAPELPLAPRAEK